MRKVVLFIIVVSLITATSILFIGCKPPLQRHEFKHDFDGLGTAPDAASAAKAESVDESKLVYNSEKTEDYAVREAAAYLFNTANENALNTDYYASFAGGGGIADVSMLGITIRGTMDTRQIIIHDGARWYNLDVGQVIDLKTVKKDDSTGDFNSMLGLAHSMLDYATRWYTPDGTTFYVQEGDTKCLDDNSIPNILKDDALHFDKVAKKNSNKYDFGGYKEKSNIRNGYFELSAMNIIADNITTASVTDNGEYYTADMVIDVDSDALDLNRKTLNSSGRELSYTSQTLKITVWKCGLIRSYHTTNAWTGIINKALKATGSSENNYDWYFSYDKSKVGKLKFPSDAAVIEFIAACNK